MVSVVGGSGVFSGPTGAQYQQAGVEGLSGALAQQRAFGEQQRAQKYKELYDLAKAEADANGVPISTIFGDTAFQETAKAMLGNTMGGFLGLGGQRRLNQFLQGLEATYGGQAGEAFGAQRAAVRGEIVRGEPVVERTMMPGYEQAVAGIMAPPAPPAAVTPPPAPGTQPPASTPAPASTPLQKNPPGFWQGTVPAADTLQPASPITQAATTKAPAGSGAGVPDPEKVREWYRNTGISLAAAFGNKDAAREKRIKDLTTAISQTEEELSMLRASGDSAKLDMKLRFHQNNIAELDRLTNGEFSKQKSGGGPVPAQVTPGLAASKPAPEAAGQSAGVGAAKKWENTDPTRAQTDQLKAFWDYALAQKRAGNPDFAEFRGTNPAAGQSIDSLKNAATGYRNTFSRWASGDTGASQGTTSASTSASTATAAPMGLELPTKLGWSSDDIALFRRFNGRDIEDYQSLSGQERADYQRYVRLNTQLKNEFTKEVRKESTGWRAADPRDKSVSTDKALEWMRASDPNGPIASDPQFSHLAENVHQLGINRVKAEISKLESEGIYTKAMAAKMFQDAQSVDLISKAAYLKERSAAVKSMAETGSKLLEPILSGYTEMLKGAKNDADRKSAEAWFNSQLANNAWFKSNAELFTKEMASVTGNPISVKQVPTEYWRFLFWSGTGESGGVPTVSPFGTGAAPASDQTAEDVMAQNGW